MREAWRLLRSNHPELIDDVADGKRFVWLGSGISRDQVPDLVELLERVLKFLRDQAATDKPDAAGHREALLEIIDEHLPEERPRYEANAAGWEPENLETLREQYSRVLGVGVAGKASDYLLIDGAKLPALYGDPALEPGPTHHMLAMLISEGVISNLASGNWDGLVEKALGHISSTAALLDVYVDVNDPRDANGHAEIAKFHGCAVRALENSERYRDKIIATSAQISNLHGAVSYEHMRDRLRDLTTRMRSLVLGLSMQDSDLLTTIRSSASRSPWKWDAHNPAYLFAEPKVLPSQRDVLEVAYGEDYSLERLTIVQRSALGAYAGPMTAALLVEVLASKLLAALRRQQGLSHEMLTALEQGIRRLVLRIVIAFGNDERSLVAFLLTEYSALIRTYMGRAAAGSAQYLPFARGTKSYIVSDFSVIAMGVDQFAAAVGMIGLGEHRGRWRVLLEDSGHGGRFSISTTRAPSETRFMLVRGASQAVDAMASEDWISGEDDMVMLQMEVGAISSTRSPGGRIGRGRKVRTRFELSWADLSDSVTGMEELMVRFETGAGIR